MCTAKLPFCADTSALNFNAIIETLAGLTSPTKILVPRKLEEIVNYVTKLDPGITPGGDQNEQ